MPNHTINWVNDHTEICDRFDERVQLMETYLNSKPDDFDGIATKRFLLGQAREQVTWYRQSINGLDFVGVVACRRALESGQPFLDTICRHTTSVKPTAAQNTNATPTSRSCHQCGRDPIPTQMRGSQMLVKLQMADYLIYAELDKAERVTHLASKNRIPVQTCYAILHEIEVRGDYKVVWGLVDGGYTNTVCISRAATDATERNPKLG